MKKYNRELIVVNLLEILFKNRELSRIQNFYPETYSALNKSWDFFPFEISNLNSELDIDSLSSTIRMPNLSYLSSIYGEADIKRDNLSKFLKGANVTVYYIFLDGEIADTENNNSFQIKEDNSGKKIMTSYNFTVNTISENSGVVTLRLQNPLTAFSSKVPQSYYAGQEYRELPVDNTPIFTVGTSYF